MTIIKQFQVKTKKDIERLNIIDFNRLNGHWQYSDQAMATIFSWFKHKAKVTIYEIEGYEDAPDRGDFPEWQHVGNHEREAKEYWNWFRSAHPDAELNLSDSPDFCGTFRNGNRFFGDFGQVSASAFAYTQKQLREHDLWISVLGHIHVIIEPMFNIWKAHQDMIMCGLTKRKSSRTLERAEKP